MELFYAFLPVLAHLVLCVALLRCLSIVASFVEIGFQHTLYSDFGYAVILVTVYRVVILPRFDPLKKYPLVNISDIRILLPVTDVPRGANALEWAKQYHDQDAVRVQVLHGSTSIVPLSVAALRDLLSTHQADFEKPSGSRSFLARILGYGLILSEGSVHTRQRKQLTSSFRLQHIRALQDLMLAKTDILLKNMEAQYKAQPETGIDITTWASKVTLDIIGMALMSKEFDSLNVEKQPVHEAFTKLTGVSFGMIVHFILSLILPQIVVASLPTATNRMLKESAAIVRNSCEKSLTAVYEAQQQDRPTTSDILASIIADPAASRREIVDQMLTFLGAGHETTATAIAWVTHLLTLPSNEHYQDSIRQELLAHPEAVTTPAVLESLPWLNAIVEETLRLFPPVTSTARIAIRDTVIAGTKVARGTMVIVFPWAINRHPRYWGGDDAEKFIPERWIDKRPDGSILVNGNGGAESNFCNLTFLHGNRSCIGKGFSKAELRLIVAKMFSEFRVKRLPGDDGQVNPVGSITIKPEGGLFVKLERIN